MRIGRFFLGLNFSPAYIKNVSSGRPGVIPAFGLRQPAAMPVCPAAGEEAG